MGYEERGCFSKLVTESEVLRKKMRAAIRQGGAMDQGSRATLFAAVHDLRTRIESFESEVMAQDEEARQRGPDLALNTDLVKALARSFRESIGRFVNATGDEAIAAVAEATAAAAKEEAVAKVQEAQREAGEAQWQAEKNERLRAEVELPLVATKPAGVAAAGATAEAARAEQQEVAEFEVAELQQEARMARAAHAATAIAGAFKVARGEEQAAAPEASRAVAAAAAAEMARAAELHAEAPRAAELHAEAPRAAELQRKEEDVRPTGTLPAGVAAALAGTGTAIGSGVSGLTAEQRARAAANRAAALERQVRSSQLNSTNVERQRMAGQLGRPLLQQPQQPPTLLPPTLSSSAAAQHSRPQAAAPPAAIAAAAAAAAEPSFTQLVEEACETQDGSGGGAVNSEEVREEIRQRRRRGQMREYSVRVEERLVHVYRPSPARWPVDSIHVHTCTPPAMWLP